MPKLRNSTTEIGAFTQWLARKCRNHSPLSELSVAPGQRKSLASTYRASQSQRSGEAIEIVGLNENVILYEAGGRTFAVTAEEITGQNETIEHLRKERRVRVGA